VRSRSKKGVASPPVVAWGEEDGRAVKDVPVVEAGLAAARVGEEAVEAQAEVDRASDRPFIPQRRRDQAVTGETASDKDRQLADKCLHCAVCKRARKKQRGLCYWFVKKLEGRICPACQAYERVYGRKAHEPVSDT
jgi:hypothetical protein